MRGSKFSEHRHTEQFEALVNVGGLDVWTHRPDGTVQVRVGRWQAKMLRALFNNSCTVVVEDLEAATREFEMSLQAAAAALRANASGADWFTAYHTYAEIVDWYKQLAASNPTLVKYVASIGKSVENRDQPALHITSQVGSDKPKIYWQCQIHAREWISSATCMFVIDHLVTNYGKKADVTRILDGAEIVLVPFVNPDGYAFTWTNDRMWRKNRGMRRGSGRRIGTARAPLLLMPVTQLRTPVAFAAAWT